MTTLTQLAALASYLCALAVASVAEPFWTQIYDTLLDAYLTTRRWLWPAHPLPSALSALSMGALGRYARYVYHGPNRALNSYEQVWTEEAFDCALNVAFWETFPRQYATPDDLPF